jgi:hypothetical protein
MHVVDHESFQSTATSGYNIDLVLDRSTKRGKENSRSDGYCQCEKEMEDHLLACQLIFEIEPFINTLW